MLLYAYEISNIYLNVSPLQALLLFLWETSLADDPALLRVSGPPLMPAGYWAMTLTPTTLNTLLH